MLNLKQQRAIDNLYMLDVEDKEYLTSLLAKGQLYQALVQYFQECRGWAGITPFCLAGIVRKSPRTVWADLQGPKGAGLEMFYCTYTQLPILSYTGWGSKLTNNHMYDIKEEEQYEEENLDGKSMTALLRRYGGKSWRKHCTRKFNPFQQPSTREVSLPEWRALQRLAGAFRVRA